MQAQLSFGPKLELDENMFGTETSLTCMPLSTGGSRKQMLRQRKRKVDAQANTVKTIAWFQTKPIGLH